MDARSETDLGCPCATAGLLQRRPALALVSDASTGVVKAASETKSDKLPAVKGAAPDVRAIASTPALDVGAAERAAKVSSRPLVDDGDEPSVRPGLKRLLMHPTGAWWAGALE
eukprot:jgi/Tetstr1/466287/TSEL_010822.t1